MKIRIIKNGLSSSSGVFIPIAQKGSANGVATLDASSKIPLSQIPDELVGIKGFWDASTNTPTLADGIGNDGDLYKVAVAGTQNLGSGNISFAIGDGVMYLSGTWQLSPGSDHEEVEDDALALAVALG